MQTIAGDPSAAGSGSPSMFTWAESTPEENLTRGVIIVALFLGSAAVALLMERGYLWLMKKFGVYRWKTTDEVISTYEMYRKVQHGAKIFLSKLSLRGNEHDIEVLRTGHFFSDGYHKLRKDANYAKDNFARNDASLEDYDDTTIIICPPDVSIYPPDTTTSIRELENMVLGRNSNPVRGGERPIDPSHQSQWNEYDSANPGVQHRGSNRRNAGGDYVFPVGSNSSRRGKQISSDSEMSDEEENKDTIKAQRFKRKIDTVTEEWIESEEKLAFRLETELRPFKSFLRGNFHPFFANVIYVFVVITGWVFAFTLIGIDFLGFLNGATFLMAVTLFKLADFMKNWIAYYGILWGDLLERGDMVTLPSTYSTPVEKTGCVLEITTSAVKILTAQIHNPLGHQDVKWEWTMPNGGINSTGAGKGILNPVTNNGSQGSQYGRYVKTFDPVSPELNANAGSQVEVDTHGDAAIYVEKHLRVIYDVVVVPNFLFTEWIISKPAFWRRTLQCRPFPKKQIASQ